MLKTLWMILLTVGIGVISATAGADAYPIALEKMPANTHNVASIERGAKAFANYCLSCHSLDYLVHDQIAINAGITAEKMPSKDKQWWFGATPPDLSLIAKIRSPDWIYTYLHVFYKDTSRPIGANNLLADNVSMPNPFGGVQGQQVLVVRKDQLFAEADTFVKKLPYYSVLELQTQGTMSSDEFDKMTSDLVNFLIYAGEPKKIIRERMGIPVLIFIAILFVLLFLLQKEYWKKIK